MSHVDYLTMCNTNNTGIMPHGVARAANPNNIMYGLHNMCTPASWVSLCNYDAPQFTYLT